jgi:hypothetical protein
MLSMLVIAAPFTLTNAQYVDILGLTVMSDKSAYYFGQPVNLFGNFTQYGQPVSNGTVAVAVYDSSGSPVAFRTVRTGSATPPGYLVDFLELTPCDQSGVTQSSFAPQQPLWVRITIKNYDLVGHYVMTPITLFDANGVPLVTLPNPFGTLAPGGSSATFFEATTVPSWAQPGNATLCASIFSGYPKGGGTPYCEEKTVNFEIKRNPETGYSAPPATNLQAPDGTFATSFKLPPQSKFGNYQVDVSARSTLMNGSVQSLMSAQSTTFFSVMNTPTPPQAAFTYSPVDSYVNMNITFDASPSVAEGYGVALVDYEWDFGDGTPKVSTTNPVKAHTFAQLSNYLVTLKVTDSQGLWCATSRFITILNPTGPKADFSWNHVDSYVNMNITFDGSASTTQANYVRIVNYQWDFGDGTPMVNTPNNVTSHTFSLVNNYPVTLKVTDSLGLWYAASKIITILPPGGPRAEFSWHPSAITPNQTVTFDATWTRLGWNGTDQPPIVNYVWDFGDTNVTNGYYPTIVHTYAGLGSYAVMLNVTDASGFNDSVTYNVVVRQTVLIGDINGDGAVNILDAILMANAFNSKQGDSNWNPNADLNSDNVVNILDAIILANHFGQKA